MSEMFDSNFDPLLELRIAQENIEALIQAVNTQATFIEELASQHEDLTKQHYRLTQSLSEAHAELRKIKGLTL